MTSRYQMWMTYNAGAERLRFPVLPERITVRYGANNRSVTVQGLGELIIKQDPGAVAVSFASFFPAAPFPGIQHGFLRTPVDLKKQIIRWKNSDKPVQFMITNTDINMYFAIRNFICHEQGGDVGTLHYSMSLEEYKQVSVRQVTIEDNTAVISAQAPKRVDNRADKLTHEVVRGDNLTTIARRHLGDGARWSEIFELNRDLISNPNLIFPGQVLRLPAA